MTSPAPDIVKDAGETHPVLVGLPSCVVIPLTGLGLDNMKDWLSVIIMSGLDVRMARLAASLAQAYTGASTSPSLSKVRLAAQTMSSASENVISSSC